MSAIAEGATTSSFEPTPTGTRGANVPFRNRGMRVMSRLLTRYHRLRGDRFQGLDVAYLTTVGARSGQQRQTSVAWFPDGDDAWLIVASAGGAANHPDWYHNIAAHPDQAHIEVGGRRLRVVPEQLEGERRDAAFQRISAEHPRYAGYRQQTDRVIPVIRLVPAQ